MAKLIVEQGTEQEEYALPEGTTLVGRHSANAIQFNDVTVSGRHARFVVDENGVSLEDLGSRNGTWVNEQPLTGRVMLTDGDLIRFSETQCRFEDRPEGVPAAGVGSETVPAVESVAPQLNVDFAEADEDASRIMDVAKSTGRFESLDVNPEAKLKAVLDLSTRLVGSMDIDSLLPAILDTLFNVFKYADRGCILLKDDASGQLIPRAFRHRRAEEDATVRLSRAVVERVLEQKEGILSADASTDDKFLLSESISELKIRSVMCVPLLGLDGEPSGIISIDSQNPLGQFTHDDLDLLTVIAGQASLSRETARLLQSYVAKEKQDNELQIARDIQHALLPTTLPTVDGYEFYACYESAQAVGGDYYDCIVLPAGKIAMSFGDVAGKGVPGALIMSRMSSCVQSTLRHVHDVEAAMLAINEHMCDSAVEGRFVTYVLAIVDTVNHRVSLSNAGHMAPMIRRADGTMEHFDDDELVGPPIGVMEDFPYDVETRDLGPGDTVVIVTDGVDEAMDPDGELYGQERTYEQIQAGSSRADELGRALLADVRRHANGRPQNDDITIMAFGRTANA